MSESHHQRCEIHARERVAWSHLIQGLPQKFVIHGQGRIGRMALEACRRGNHPVVCFCDREASHERLAAIEGLPVLSPAEAAVRHGEDCTFISAIWTGDGTEGVADRIASLKALGCRHVVPFSALLWAHGPEKIDLHGFARPSFFLERESEWNWLGGEFADPESQRVFQNWYARVVEGRFARSRPAPNQYFPSDILRLGGSEIVLDAGAYWGDTLESYLHAAHGSLERYYALEPDRVSMDALRSRVAGLPTAIANRVVLLPFAAGKENGRSGFAESGTPTSSVSPSGARMVDVRRLDDVIEGPITFLKLDVEGFELEVLDGAENLLRTSAPTVAACVYHRPDHLWRIASLLRGLLPSHVLFLREHGFDGWEMVLYAVAPAHAAIPVERLSTS